MTKKKFNFDKIKSSKKKGKIADKSGGRCQPERAAISRAPKGRAKGLALQKFMVCKRGGGKSKKGKK